MSRACNLQLPHLRLTFAGPMAVNILIEGELQKIQLQFI